MNEVRSFGTSRLKSRSALANWSGFFLFSVILLTRLALHPLWRDEAHAWTIAAAANSPLDLFAVPSEVHPPLWFWMLEFVQLFSADLNAMKVIIGVAAVGTLALLWLASGLSLLEKVLISASYHISWQYGVFSRNYMPGVLFLVLFSVFWVQWRRHPIAGAILLGLACLTHAFFVPVAGILALLFLWDWWNEEHTARALIFAGVFGALMLVAVVSLYMAVPTMEVVIDQAAPAAETKQLISRIGYAFTVEFIGEPFETIAGLLYFTAFLPLTSVVLLAAVGALFLSAIQVFLYGGLAWHMGAIYVLFICIYVVYRQKIHRAIPTALLAVSAIGGVLVPINHDLPYSTGQQAANLIREAGLEDGNWAAFPDIGGEVPFAVLGRRYWTIECACDIARVNWRNRLLEVDTATFLARFEAFVRRGAGNPSFLLLSRSRATTIVPALRTKYDVDRIGETPPAEALDESYLLLRIAPR